MKNVGIVFDNIRADQLSYYAIKTINQYYGKNNLDVSFSIFYENLQRPSIEPNCAVMNVSHAYGFPGDIAVTSFPTALRFCDIPIQGKKTFYVYDIDWSRQAIAWELLNKVYRNPEYSILFRCEDHARIFENCFNRQVEDIVKDGEFPTCLI